jgi:hypothetical protein
LKRKALPILIILVAAASLGAQTSELKEITYQRDGTKLVVQILVDGTFSHEILALDFPRRLVLDFTPVVKINAAPYTQIDDVGVLAIRTGQFNAQTARVVFDLADRTPSYSLAPLPGGFRISFWLEGGEEPLPQIPPREAAKPARVPAKVEEAREWPAEAPSGPRRTNFFAGARGGAAFLLKPQLLNANEFILFGETGSLEETYDYKAGPIVDVFAGKYFNNIKAGVGLTIWSLKQENTFSLSVPHPFQANTPREVSFASGQLKNAMLNIYAFAEYSFFDSENFGVWAGIIAGLTKGAFQTLDDFDQTENPPYAASDVVVSNVTYVEDTYTDLLFGGLLTFEYRMSHLISLVFEAKMLYSNPKILSLGARANYLQVQPVLGLQFNF